jgi:acyl dehydratase
MTLTFEDFTPGPMGSYGPRHITREEIVAFARDYDPQPMHLDDDAANASMLKGLAGSGWHMGSLMMRMLCDGFLLNTAFLGSLGVNEMKWLAPFRPGDDLMLDVEVAEARVSKSRPTSGVVTLRCAARTTAGRAVAEMVLVILVGRSDAATSQAAS